MAGGGVGGGAPFYEICVADTHIYDLVIPTHAQIGNHTRKANQLAIVKVGYLVRFQKIGSIGKQIGNLFHQIEGPDCLHPASVRGGCLMFSSKVSSVGENVANSSMRFGR